MAGDVRGRGGSVGGRGGHALQGGIHGRGHAWRLGVHGGWACMAGGGGFVWQGGMHGRGLLRRAVRTTLECILVIKIIIFVNINTTIYTVKAK